MILFAIAAAVLAVIHLMAAWQRPRSAVILSGVLWLLYAVYEHQVATGVLCDSDCNIRVDLVLFFPILALTTFCAYQSYLGEPGQMKVIGTILGIIGLFVVALVVEGLGYATLSLVLFAGGLAIIVYAISKLRPTGS
jgi:hypothetical protein